MFTPLVDLVEQLYYSHVFTVSAMDDPVTFYADSLQKAFKGMGTNDDQLIKIIISRAEVLLMSFCNIVFI
jgi:hypothetical protein